MYFFFFNDTATTEIYTLSLHDALPILRLSITTWNINSVRVRNGQVQRFLEDARPDILCLQETKCPDNCFPLDRKSTRLNSSHANISYAVFCLKKKKQKKSIYTGIVSSR